MEIWVIFVVPVICFNILASIIFIIQKNKIDKLKESFHKGLKIPMINFPSIAFIISFIVVLAGLVISYRLISFKDDNILINNIEIGVAKIKVAKEEIEIQEYYFQARRFIEEQEYSEAITKANLIITSGDIGDYSYEMLYIVGRYMEGDSSEISERLMNLNLVDADIKDKYDSWHEKTLEISYKSHDNIFLFYFTNSDTYADSLAVFYMGLSEYKISIFVKGDEYSNEEFGFVEINKDDINNQIINLDIVVQDIDDNIIDETTIEDFLFVDASGINKLTFSDEQLNAKYLYISNGNNLSDLKGLEPLNSLQHLVLQDCEKANNLSAIESFNSLISIRLQLCTSLNDIVSIVQHPNIETIEIWGCPNIYDYSFLSNLSSLEFLHLGDSEIVDLSYLNGLNNLRLLSLNQSNYFANHYIIEALNANGCYIN